MIKTGRIICKEAFKYQVISRNLFHFRNLDPAEDKLTGRDILYLQGITESGEECITELYCTIFNTENRPFFQLDHVKVCYYTKQRISAGS